MPPFEVHGRIPFGNVADVCIHEDRDATRVEFTAHPHGGVESLWFCFRIERRGPAGPGRITLVLKHVGTLLAGLQPGICEVMRPVVRYEGGDWRRVEPGAADTTPDGRQRAVWSIDAPATHADVAFCYPYGRGELDELLRDTRGYWASDVIGVSQAGRPFVRLSNGPGAHEDQRPGLYLLARQHAGETSGSWLLDGLLRRLAEAGDAAPLTWCVPLADIDGIERGDYGKDAFPHDLARAWGRWAMRHEVQIMQRDMRLWASRCRPMLVIDFHAPAPGEAEGVYFFTRFSHEDVPEHAEAAAWSEHFRGALGEFAAERFTRVATHGGRWITEPTISAFAHHQLKTLALLFEVPYSLARGRVLTRELYRDAGRRCADALLSAIPRTP